MAGDLGPVRASQRVADSNTRAGKEADWGSEGSSSGGKAAQRAAETTAPTEFGGPAGVAAMMIGFPLLMYYLWASLEYNHGRLLVPASLAEIPAFARDLYWMVVVGAPLTMRGVQVYGLFVLFQVALALIMPGPVCRGHMLPPSVAKLEGGQTSLTYRCNGVLSWYATLLLSAVFHRAGWFRLTTVIDEFGPIMTAAIAYGFGVSVLSYAITIAQGRQHRMSGNVVYDFFMGAPLNPRLFGGRLDLKMFCEIRIPWVVLFYISFAMVIKQVEETGHASTSAWFLTLAHFLYVNACHKGEECIPTTWDIFYEKWGFMLIFWNLAGVPFTYCLSALYVAKQGADFAPLPPWANRTLFLVLLVSYYVWDTANSQKNRFRMQLHGSYVPRHTFPQLPWGTLSNPSFMRTQSGSLLLTDGWWRYVRKPHYMADMVMELTLGLICGFDSPLPYFYFSFFVVMITHRAARDACRCAEKYGRDWDAYLERVPYVLIPGIY